MSRVPIQPNELRKGDVVEIVEQGVTVKELSSYGHGLYSEDNIFYPVHPETKMFLIKRAPVYPFNYPPQAGDVWINATGRMYFVTDGRVYTEKGYGHTLSDIQRAMVNPNAGYRLLFRNG